MKASLLTLSTPKLKPCRCIIYLVTDTNILFLCMCTFLLRHSESIIELIPPLHVLSHASEVTLEDFTAGPLDLMINIPSS